MNTNKCLFKVNSKYIVMREREKSVGTCRMQTVENEQG